MMRNLMRFVAGVATVAVVGIGGATTAIGATAIGQDALVNYSTKFEIDSDRESKATGETHVISVAASYSNPNDEKDTTLRLYLWEYDPIYDLSREEFKNIRKPLSGVKLTDFVDGEAHFALEDNPDTSVTLQIGRAHV